jgi:hypothetical protein
MADKISHQWPEPPEPDILPGGSEGEILVWTPPAIPWAGLEHDPMMDGTALLVDYKVFGGLWEAINRRLQGDGPNRWIDLNDAVWIIAQKLNVRPGVARELLLKEAVPPAVPWVGAGYGLPKNGTRLLVPVEMDRALVIRTDTRFGYEDMNSFPRAPRIRCIYIELNHLEAWLEKRKAPAVQPASREADSEPEAPDPYRNGFPGRPSIRHLILAEFERRAQAGEMLPEVGKEAQALQKWAAENHPKARPPTRGAIENLIRDSHRKLRSTK